MRTEYVFDLTDSRLPASIGNKADKLRFMANKGFQIPVTHVVSWEAYSQYLNDDPEIVGSVRAELLEMVDPGTRYAIRSSANTEDSLDFSFAGQFKSVLDVQGADEILHAIWSIWATTLSPSVQTYLDKNRIDPHELQMVVIVQEMVPSHVSGVSFSKNPMTGMDEIIIEAVKGSGEALVQEGVTPWRWINKWGAWISKPDDDAIQLAIIQEVAEQTKAIANAYGQAVDLEWVFDGQRFRWVQLREITSIDIDVYSNHISKEVFPGSIKPLVWSVNVPLVNGAWVRLFTELIGPNDIDPLSLARSFFYRAYFNMGAIGRIFELLGMPSETLELLMGIEIGGPDKPSFKPSSKTCRLLPRMLRVAAGKLGFARKIKRFVPSAQERYQRYRSKQIDGWSARELLDQIDGLYDVTREAAYYNIVTPLLMQIYNRVLKGQLSRTGVDFEGLDVTDGLTELQQFEPNVHLTELNQLYNQLDEALRERINRSSYDDFRKLCGVEGLQAQVQRFLDQFGHLSDSGNDFSSVPWREDPDLILRMLVNHVAPEDTLQARARFEDLPMSPVRRLLLRPLYKRARQYRLHREAVSSLYTFGYGLFRDYFLALGDCFVRQGVVRSRDAILYLYFDEVRSIVNNDHAQNEYQPKIDRRKREMEDCERVLPPPIIYGDDIPPLETDTADVLKGTPTSRGYYTGPIRIVQGIRDFDKLEVGDVLVIPFSDVGWTPLFTKAGAVIAEAGGILSHSSIVAREYKIPAVVSVPGACQLADDTVVTIDGYRGEIVIHASPDG